MIAGKSPEKGITIAIDGPVASGKGTLAPLLAAQLNGFYLQTGAMYRCVALSCMKDQIDWANEQAVVRELPKLSITFTADAVLVNGEDVTAEIRKEMVSMAASKIATMPQVRQEMVTRQQALAAAMLREGKIVIAEGRDTGTRLFPEASLKIFLTAKPEIRARRRVAQLRAMGREANYATVFSELMARDTQDQERKTDPLVTEPEKYGYTVIDDSSLSEEETITTILTMMKERGLL